MSFSHTKLGVPIIYIAIEVVMVLLIQSAQNEDGEVQYNTSTIVLSMEILKLLVSLFLCHKEGSLNVLKATSWRDIPPYGVPALLYCINNNIFVQIFTVLEPTIFQVICNVRVIWTALVYSFFLKRNINRNQWIACTMLMCGAVLSQVDEYYQIQSRAEHDPTHEVVGDGFGLVIDTITSIFSVGMMLALLYTVISVAAGVSCELLLKKQDSANVPNVFLYSFGIFFNLLTSLVQSMTASGVKSQAEADLTFMDKYFRGRSTTQTHTMLPYAAQPMREPSITPNVKIGTHCYAPVLVYTTFLRMPVHLCLCSARGTYMDAFKNILTHMPNTTHTQGGNWEAHG